VVGESLADDARRRGTVDNFLAELDELASSGDGAR
jgi:F-type H+-transporting ATPase subunit b